MSRLARTLWAAGALALLTALPPAQAALALRGEHQVVALTADGQRTVIAELRLEPTGAGAARYTLRWLTEAFSDHFLSMREFKCLPGAQEISCQVPYPYPHPREVAPGQWVWLEHDLLFLHKSPAEYGARLWNGLYFVLREEGDALVGEPMAVDLNEIAAPPADSAVPPYGATRRHAVPPQARWLRALRIEPR